MVSRQAVAQIGLFSWLLSTVIPFFFISDWAARVAFYSSSVPTIIYASGFSLYILLANMAFPKHLIAGMRQGSVNLVFIVFLAFLSLQILLSPASIRPFQSLLYSFMTLYVFISIYGLFSYRIFDIRQTGYIFGIIISIFLISLFFIHGFTGRTIGAIQPNAYAKAFFVAAILVSISRPSLTWHMLLLSFSIALIVSSRGAILANILSIVIVLLSTGVNSRRLRAIAIFCIIFSIVSLVDAFFGYQLYGAVLIELLDLLDPKRGIGSGLTGRVEHWREGFYQFLDAPIFGYGFRTRESVDAEIGQLVSAHSGWLNLLLDTGIVGGCLFFAASILLIYNTVNLVRNSCDKNSRVCHSLVLSFLVTFYLFMFLDPIYLNLGHNFSVMFFILYGLIAGHGNPPR